MGAGTAPDEDYTVPAQHHTPEFTTEMRDWIIIFLLFVTSVAIVTQIGLSVFWSAVAGLVAGAGYWAWSGEIAEGLGRPLRSLPYGIVFFGLTFFTFAEQFSRTAFVTGRLIPGLRSLLEPGSLEAAFGAVYGSGMLVNVFNDLPAAAMVGQVLPRLDAGLVLVQATVAGLNIGTYVTPIGALAGLIWFNQIRIHRQHHAATEPEQASRMRFPSRSDLVRYGLTHFIITAAVIGAVLTLEGVVLSALAGM